MFTSSALTQMMCWSATPSVGKRGSKKLYTKLLTLVLNILWAKMAPPVSSGHNDSLSFL